MIDRRKSQRHGQGSVQDIGLVPLEHGRHGDVAERPADRCHRRLFSEFLDMQFTVLALDASRITIGVQIALKVVGQCGLIMKNRRVPIAIPREIGKREFRGDPAAVEGSECHCEIVEEKRDFSGGFVHYIVFPEKFIVFCIVQVSDDYQHSLAGR